MASSTPARAERAIVRFGIPTLLLASAAGAILVSLHTTKSEIPGFAFGSHVVLMVQLTLLFFYGALLLVLPLVRAVSGGELPIELSMRGARFAEAKLTLANEETLERLERAEESLAELAGVGVRADQFGENLRTLGQKVDALDVRNQKAAAETDERLLKLAEVLEGPEGKG